MLIRKYVEGILKAFNLLTSEIIIHRKSNIINYKEIELQNEK
jgi:hypothetical protein